MQEQYGVSYSLSHTVVRVTAKTTTKQDLLKNKPTRSTEAQVEVANVADPAARTTLALHENKLSDASLTLTFADDGRLLSAEHSSTGKLGQIIKAGVQIVTSVAATAAAIARGGAADAINQQDAKEKTASVQELYEKKHPQVGAARKRIESASTQLTEQLVKLGSALAEARDSTEEKDIAARLDRVKSALKTLRDEQILIEQHFSSWKTTAEGAETRSLDYEFQLSQLPRVTYLDANWNPSADDLDDEVASCYETTGVIVGVVDAYAENDRHWKPEPGPYIYYRQPRQIELGLYVKSERGTELVKTLRVLGIDEFSRLAWLELGESKFAKRTATATFKDTGSLEKLGNTSESPLATAATTAAELPAAVFGSLEQANKILEQHRKLATSGIDMRIAELEQRKKLLETEAAHSGLAATVLERAELEKVKAQIDLLKNRKDLAALPGAGDLE